MSWRACERLVFHQDYPFMQILHLSGVVSQEEKMTEFLVHKCPKLRLLSFNGLRIMDGPSTGGGSFIRLLRRTGRALVLEQFELQGVINENNWIWNIDPSKETDGSLLRQVKYYMLRKGDFPFPDPEEPDFQDSYWQFLQPCKTPVF